MSNSKNLGKIVTDVKKSVRCRYCSLGGQTLPTVISRLNRGSLCPSLLSCGGAISRLFRGSQAEVLVGSFCCPNETAGGGSPVGTEPRDFPLIFFFKGRVRRAGSLLGEA